MSSEPAPAKLPPPWIHTMTAAGVFMGHFGVHTFKYRQSSLLLAPRLPPCTQLEPKAVASRTPVQGFAGSGSCQRRPATGGCANGMPLKTAPPSEVTPPRRLPVFTLTVGPCSAGAAVEACDQQRIQT